MLPCLCWIPKAPQQLLGSTRGQPASRCALARKEGLTDTLAGGLNTASRALPGSVRTTLHQLIDTNAKV